MRLTVVTLSLRTGTPVGLVTITDGSKIICRLELVNDVASCKLSAAQLGVGTHHLVVTYAGNPAYLPSTTSGKLTIDR